MTLRYPMEIGGIASPDYVQFTPMKYRSNVEQRIDRLGGRTDSAAAASDPGADAVILYMPNSTPSVSNRNSWGADGKFAGPVGEMTKMAGMAGANAIDTGLDVGGHLQNVMNSGPGIAYGAGLVGGAAQQKLLEAMGDSFGATGAQLLAISKGKVFNPNVELIYSAPGMRDFNFTFKFVPKNKPEAIMLNRIILNFKKWSAPGNLGNGMMQVPHVWQVKYMSGGQENPNMNKFKKAACTAVSVQANPQTSMHVAHVDGMPIETTMSLNFKEVDIITREDHTNAGGQGY